MNRLITTFVFTIFLATQVFAKAPIKFGKVSDEEVAMTVYEPDTSAAAVVLCKYGYFNANDYQYSLLRRVKILKKSGVAYSTFSFPGDEDSGVRIKVFNMVNGEIKSEKVGKECVFKERVTDDYYRIRVAVPNVKVGTVFDVEFYRPMLPPEFAFQEDIPVVHSELNMEESKYITWRKRPVGDLVYKKTSDYTYAADNVPAFKPEPFINSANNYKSKFEFDILNVFIPGTVYRNYTTDWESVNDRLAANDYFAGVLINGSGYLSEIIDEINAKYTTPYDKMNAAYEAIKKIKWNGSNRLFASTTSLSTVFKDGEASSAELNLMLLQLLIKMDFIALPVVMSTRDNGILHQIYPSYEKLNYVIAWVKIDDTEYLLDATAEEMPAGLLPIRCLNQRARLVTNERGKWIDLKTDKGDDETMMYTLNLKEDLSLEGNIQYNRKNYSASNFRHRFKEFSGEDEYLQSLEIKYPGLRITSSEIENVDNINQPIKDTYEVKIKNMVQEVGDMITINPFLFEKINENPFKLEQRTYPVDFAFNEHKMMISRFNIPDIYTVNGLPDPIHIKLPDNSASVLINYQKVGQTISVTYKFSRDKAIYQPNEYTYLKQLFGVIIEKQSEPIILKKNETTANL